MLQGATPVPRSTLDLVLIASPETKVVLVITVIASLVSWFIIIAKWWQFRRLNRQADRFFSEMERSTRLQEAYHAVMKQPPSPYSRLFREAMTFYSELRPGALDRPGERGSLTPTQLEALKMVLGKEVAAERDLLGHYIPWLAIVGREMENLAVVPERQREWLELAFLFQHLGCEIDGAIEQRVHLLTGIGQPGRRGAGGGRGAGGDLWRPSRGNSGRDCLQPVREPDPALRRRAGGLRQRADRYHGSGRIGLTWRSVWVAGWAETAEGKWRSTPT